MHATAATSEPRPSTLPASKTWRVAVSYGEHKLTQDVKAASAVEAIGVMAEWLCVSTDEFTSASATAI
jgi:hypothetical protein